MESTSIEFSQEEINSRHEVFLNRISLYKKYGFDQDDARKNIITQLSDSNRSLVEIGTGKGHLTSMLARSFERVVTVDLNSDDQRAAMLKAAYYNQLDKIEFVTADAAKLEFSDRSFDAVVSAYTFHHLKLPFKVIKEMVRIADKQIVIADFNSKGFGIVERIHESEGNSHQREAGEFDIVGRFLEEFNFEVKVIEDDFQTIYSAYRKD